MNKQPVINANCHSAHFVWFQLRFIIPKIILLLYSIFCPFNKRRVSWSHSQKLLVVCFRMFILSERHFQKTSSFFSNYNQRIDKPIRSRYPTLCPGGSGAAETCEPRQVREEAAVSGLFWVPPGCLPGYFVFSVRINASMLTCPHQTKIHKNNP